MFYFASVISDSDIRAAGAHCMQKTGHKPNDLNLPTSTRNLTKFITDFTY
jgi:hypothetical protein